ERGLCSVGPNGVSRSKATDAGDCCQLSAASSIDRRAYGARKAKVKLNAGPPNQQQPARSTTAEFTCANRSQRKRQNVRHRAAHCTYSYQVSTTQRFISPVS